MDGVKNERSTLFFSPLCSSAFLAASSLPGSHDENRSIPGVESGEYAGGLRRRDRSAQTATHAPNAAFADPSYRWNEWDLRREALALAVGNGAAAGGGAAGGPAARARAAQTLTSAGRRNVHAQFANRIHHQDDGRANRATQTAK